MITIKRLTPPLQTPAYTRRPRTAATKVILRAHDEIGITPQKRRSLKAAIQAFMQRFNPEGHKSIMVEYKLPSGQYPLELTALTGTNPSQKGLSIRGNGRTISDSIQHDGTLDPSGKRLAKNFPYVFREQFRRQVTALKAALAIMTSAKPNEVKVKVLK